MKTNFIRKATAYELIPTDEFVIEKTIVLEQYLFECFIHHPLDDYEFIRENLKLMYCDQNEVFHCIFVTSDSHDFGILVESEGSHYARYAAYLSKMEKDK
ncbi:TPA: hypothetical protein DCW61_01055 [Candidatus Uhrbacteria bacterium]|nr:hypothetical protein [Candidatus Uhrbacteria bacterium]